MGCNPMCKGIMGVLVLAAGVLMLLGGLGSMSGTLVTVVPGALLALYGLGKLVHAGGMCGACAKEK
ncbi:hypothetical protein HZC07_04715 [Candidatus Micrarchaeota archaeon]|nr:hypothetical protein [Candidatus Micrarchaeota archaeon]